VTARAIGDLHNIFILVDGLHRHEALARVRQRDGHRPCIEIEYRDGIERVAVAARDDLALERREPTVVMKFAEAAIPYNPAKRPVDSARVKLSAVTGIAALVASVGAWPGVMDIAVSLAVCFLVR